MEKDFNEVITNMIKSAISINAEQSVMVLVDAGYSLTIQLDKCIEDIIEDDEDEDEDGEEA